VPETSASAAPVLLSRGLGTSRLVAGGWYHEAVLYDGAGSYVARLLPFLREGIARDEAIMVAVAPDRIGLLTEALGADAERVRFVDMRRMGRNPARIIPEWQAFADTTAGRPARGIGEPVWPGRTGDELQECVLHEALLNVAFADAGGFRLLCPYDRARLPDPVLDAARATHPVLDEGGGSCASGCFHVELPAPALSAVPGEARRIVFDGQTLGDVRRAWPTRRPSWRSPTASATRRCWPSTSWPRTASATAAGTAKCTSGATATSWSARCATPVSSTTGWRDGGGRTSSSSAAAGCGW